MYVSVSCACHAWKGQKRAPDPLRLDSQIAVSHHMHSGNQTWVLWESEGCVQP